ncbi:thiocillin family RiPP [uncultured Actinomyces sp.]|uniref:thiocillin family RiPP n=1 Tax=uncultured Actinomyces sp. TaxID=249061 RepID=UPI00288C51E4|nr:thiocillin family RiPP [uncultured Actinomyces sp.]
MTDDIDLSALDDSDLEVLPEGNALGCTFCASCASTGSCPTSTTATVGTASSMG